MNIARALSVVEGNGDVSWCASQEMSVEGIDCRGNRAACSSGPEKSRHFRHCPGDGEVVPLVVAVPFNLGLDLLSSARLGREDKGTGGGEAEDGRFDGSGGEVSVVLFREKSSADLRGGLGGGSSSAVSVVLLDLDGTGGLLGSEGGGSRLDLRLTFRAEMVGRKGTRGSIPMPSFVFFFSGSGGSVAGSYSGALTRYLAPFTCPFAEAVLVLVLGVEAAEKEERAERAEDRDSLESCLVKDCSDGLRGGKPGGILSVGRRGGSDGRASSSLPSHFLITGGGSRSLCPAAVWLPTPWLALPLLRTGGERCSPGLLGNGGGGALVFFATAWS